MGLAKQKIPIAFGEGLDTKTDPKQQLLGKLRKAQNIVFETLQSARKRNGYDSILLATTSGTTISSAATLTKFKNELNLMDATKFYSFSESLLKMQEKGSIYSVAPNSTPVLNNDYDHDAIDSVFVENLKIVVYHNTILGDVRYSVVDAQTESLIVSNDVVSASSNFVRVANIQNFVYIIYNNGANLRYRRFNILTPSTLEAAVTLQTDLDSSNVKFDAQSANNKIIVAYLSTNIGAELAVFPINTDGTAGSTVGVTGANPTECLDMFIDITSRVVISFATTTEAAYVIFPFNLTAPLLAVTTIETISDVVNITAAQMGPTQYQFYYEILAADTVDNYVRQCTASMAGVVGTPEDFLRSVGLAAKTFEHDDSNYIVLAHDTVLQKTYFIADAAGTILVKISPSLGGGIISLGVLAKVNTISDDEFVLHTQIQGKLESENGTFFTLFGVNSTNLDFAPVNAHQNALLGNNLHIAGGVLQMYDGDMVVEHGFHVYPEVLVEGSGSASGGSMSDGNYGYIALYKWTDNYGQQHRSTPSGVLNVIVSGGGSSQTQDIEVPALRLTSKENVVIELYRTENNGTIFYRVTDVTAPDFNDTTVDAITITDGISDADLISKEILYTTGGVLENTTTPAASIVATHTASNRIFLITDDNTYQYSKIHAPNQPVEFNDTLQGSVDPVGGAITACASMDEKFVIFESDAVLFISGDGPNNLGEQDTFTVPEIIASDVGCIEARSVVLTPAGLMFKSRKGIFILSQGLALDYIGAEVEEFNSLTITSAKVIGELNQVRFTTIDGDCLVYNYHLGLWSTFTNHRAKSAEVVGNDYYYIRSNDTLFKENRDSFSDNGSPIKLLMETGWMSFNQMQGFMRAYKLLILGQYKSSHKLRTQFAYNFMEAFTQEKIIDVDAFINPVAYGASSPYGAESPYGGEGTPYQARIDLKQQKCQSIKIRIEDIQEQAGEGLSLSVLTFEVGGKEGVFKINTAQKFGSS